MAQGRCMKCKAQVEIKNGKETKTKMRLSQDKGFPEELSAFLKEDTNDFPDSAYATLTTFKSWESVEKGMPVSFEKNYIALSDTH